MAAICLEDGEGRIVLCVDERIESNHAGGNIGFKISVAGPQLAALYAGDPSQAEDFLATSRTVFDSNPLSRNTVYDILNGVVSTHREKIYERHLRNSLGVSYDRFLTRGETEIDGKTRNEIFTELRDLDFGCELIIIGFISEREFMFYVSNHGAISRIHDFITIGSGSVIADSLLFLRAQRHDNSVERTLYNLYEASQLSKRVAPGVGETKDFAVLEAPFPGCSSMGMRILNRPSIERLKESFDQVGLRPLVTEPTFEPDSYSRVMERRSPDSQASERD
jgi:hypothetical protein